MDRKQKYFIFSFIVLGALLVTLGGSYALWKTVLQGTKENYLQVGNLSVVLDDTMNGEELQLGSSFPISEVVAETLKGYRFSIENKGTIGSDYRISIEDIALSTSKERMPASAVKYKLVNTTLKKERVGFLSENNQILLEDFLATTSKNEFILTLWIPESVGNEAQNKEFAGKLKIEASSTFIYRDNTGRMLQS